MIRKSTIVALTIVAMSALVLFGQGVRVDAVGMRGTAMGRAHGVMPMSGIFDQLGLTADQKAKIDTIRQNSKTQRDAVVADTSLSADARKAKLRDIRSSERTQINQVLTPAQKQQLKTLVKARMSERFDAMAKKLGLTANQQAQIKSIRESSKTQIKAVMSDTTLSASDKATKIAGIRAATHDKFMAVLTPEQKAKIAARRNSKAK